MYKQPFAMGVDWPEICCLMEVSTMVLYLHILCFYFVGHNSVSGYSAYQRDNSQFQPDVDIM